MKTKGVPDPSDIEGGVQDGRVQKAKNSGSQKKVVETAEIKEYLNKLQEIVPFMPKNKRLRKVEVISYAIDYIRELRRTLGLPPCEEGTGEDIEDSYQSMMTMVTDPVSRIKLSVVNNETNQSPPLSLSSSSSPSSYQRQPLIDISSPSNTAHPSSLPIPNDDSFPIAQTQQDVSKSIVAL